MEDLSNQIFFYCQNNNYPDYGKGDAKNLVVRDCFGKNMDIRFL